MSLISRNVTVSDRDLIIRSIPVVFIGAFLWKLILRSAGLCRARLCGIWRAPSRTLRFLGDGGSSRRGSGMSSLLIQSLPQCSPRRITLETRPTSQHQAIGSMDTGRGIINSSRSCLTIIDRFRGWIRKA